MWQMKFWTFFELVSVSFCVQEASLFSLAPRSLIEGGIFWLIRLQIITEQWVVVLFVWSSFVILYESQAFKQ